MLKRTIFYLLSYLFICSSVFSQSNDSDSLQGFDSNRVYGEMLAHNIDSSEFSYYLSIAERRYIDKKYELGIYAPPAPINHERTSQDCIDANWDFEKGNFDGWITSGNVEVVGSNVDPYGGYNWLYPDGGNFSAKLSSDQPDALTNNKDGRIDHVINVPSTGSTIFKFHFVFNMINYPHDPDDAARFWVEFYNVQGVKINCPSYECFYSDLNGAEGVANINTTSQPANYYNQNSSGENPGSNSVSYSNWNSVSADLSAYQGQSITAVFRVEWCIFKVDWAYALIEAECPYSEAHEIDECMNSYTNSSHLCGPDDMASYEWKDENDNIVGASQCYSAANIGLYSVKCLPAGVDCGSPTPFFLYYRVNPYPDLMVNVDNNCINKMVEFIDESTSNAPLTNWEWVLDNSIVSTSKNYDTTFSEDGNHTFQLSVVDALGCTDTIDGSFLIYKDPVADFTLTNACYKDENTATSTADGLGYQIVQYLWDYTNDLVDDTASVSINHIYPYPGVYNLHHTVIDEHGCKNDTIKSIEVFELPVADFYSDSVCEGDTTSFTNLSTINSNDLISSFSWNFGNGNTSSVSAPKEKYADENIYFAKLLVTSVKGCKDSIIKPVVVYPNPTANFIYDSEMCLGVEATFHSTSNVFSNYTNTAIIDWQWDFNGEGTDTGISSVFQFDNEGTYNVNLTVTSNKGCKNDTNMSLTVYPLPEVSFTGENLEGCSPIFPNVTSTSTISAPSTITNYEWEFDDGTYKTGSEPFFSNKLETFGGNDISLGLKLTVTSNQGCKSNYYASDLISVYHNPIAEFRYTPDFPSILKTEIQFLNKSEFADLYDWSFGGHGFSFDVNPMINFVPEPDSFYVYLIAKTDYGCADTTRSFVRIRDELLLYIPNSFTPNNDNTNENFLPIFGSGFDPREYSFLIFNRWGEVIFESHDVNIGWAGDYGAKNKKPVRPGTYIWKIYFKKAGEDSHFDYTGHVNLIK